MPSNVILICTDNQQAATLGCMGNPEVHSPHIDAMAAQGAVFEQAFCANAFCSPSRASMLTGQLPSQHGVHSWIDDRRSADWPQGWHALAGHLTLPEALKARGYATGLFGKYHLGQPQDPAPGWDRWVTMADGHVRGFYDTQIYDDGRSYVHADHSVDFFTDKAVEFITRQTGPYFAYIPFPAPYGHWPATKDGRRNRHAARYDDCPIDTVPRRSLSPEAVAHYDRIKSQSGGGLDFSMLLRAPNDLETLRNYYSQITMIDDAVGRILAAAPDALVVYTADHGLSLGHHGFWGHGAATYPSNLHRAAHSIPMILRQPGQIPAGLRHQTLVSNTDLFATILDAAEAPQPPDLPSRSMLKLARGTPDDAWGEDVVYAEQEETRVIRTPRWVFFKRMRGARGPDLPDALYDVIADPGETRNLAQDPALAPVVEVLSAKITRYFDLHSDPRADLWRGGQPIQNTMMGGFWREHWGPDWAPVYSYDSQILHS